MAFAFTLRFLIESEPFLGPVAQFLFRGVRRKAFALIDFGLRGEGLHVLSGGADVAGAGRREGDDGLAAEIVGFHERVDDGRFTIPPDREADEYDVVLRHVRHFACDRRPG